MYAVLLSARKRLTMSLFFSQVFYARFANVPFSLGDFENFQKHFTVSFFAPFFVSARSDGVSFIFNANR